MSETLEGRYRKLLRILPKSYLQAREEELLSVLMEGAAEGQRWPEAREALSLARLGMRVRLGEATGGAPVRTQAGATARIVAVAGTMLLALTGTIQFAVVVSTIRLNPQARWSLSHPFTIRFPGGLDFAIGYAAVPVIWLAVLALISVGWWRAAKVLAPVLFVLAAFQTGGTRSALQEETLLAAVVTMAIFAVRGAHTGPVRVAGPLGIAVTLVLGLWVNGVFGDVAGPYGRELLRAFGALQAWAVSDNHHVLVIGAFLVVVGGAVAYRSVVWPVALAVVTLATLAPVVLWGAVHPGAEGSDLAPLVFALCALTAVAGLAVARDRRAGRRERPTAAG
jgi:hypothetical protein